LSKTVETPETTGKVGTRNFTFLRYFWSKADGWRGEGGVFAIENRKWKIENGKIQFLRTI
jgi:hypothetical protein